MDDITDVSLVPLTESRFLTPMRMMYKQTGRSKMWDLMKSYSSVAVVIFNTDTDMFIFVKQFRPACYVHNAALIEGRLLSAGDKIDTEKVPGHYGLTLELCAGIIDKELSEVEIAREEVKEECGYMVPVENFRRIIKFPSSVGTGGSTQTLFSVEVTNKNKIGSGGGLVEEGEMIDVVEMTVEQVKDYLTKETVNSPVGLLYALQWYLSNRLPNIKK